MAVQVWGGVMGVGWEMEWIRFRVRRRQGWSVLGCGKLVWAGIQIGRKIWAVRGKPGPTKKCDYRFFVAECAYTSDVQ